MDKAKILYISQEIQPFLPETTISSVSRHLPQGVHEKGKEIRVFMPRFGRINERRHQLHEVIRLSGMNMIINDTDHPLIIKVASIPTARMQVYFIDNEEYFKRKAGLCDENGKQFADNDERSIFFVRGVLETVKKLGWKPDVIHCHGWMTATVPAYLQKIYKQDPHFENAKVLYSVYDEGFEGTLDKKMIDKVAFDGINSADLDVIKSPTFENLNKLAIQYADGVIFAGSNVGDEVKLLANERDIPVLEQMSEDNYIGDISNFYDTILEGKEVLLEE